MDIHVRRESKRDAEAIERIIAEAFRSAAHTSGTEHLIVRQLRECGALAVSLVALVDDAVAGHVAASPVTVSDGTSGWYGLGPVSVLPQQQGRGLGSALVTEALQRLRSAGAAGCVVLGEPGYYGRFGFHDYPALVLPGVPPAYFQSLAFDGPVPHGVVSYHPAFDAQA